MYLRNGGMRAVAEMFGVNASTILKWVRAFLKHFEHLIQKARIELKTQQEPDIIELDEIVIWTAYSRGEGRVIAFVIGEGLKAAKEIYQKVKKLRQNILAIYTDANSCYESAFRGIKESHIMTKAETHLIESSNSSIRDQLARFNRRTKRYSKSLELHFYRHIIFSM